MLHILTTPVNELFSRPSQESRPLISRHTATLLSLIPMGTTQKDTCEIIAPHIDKQMLEDFSKISGYRVTSVYICDDEEFKEALKKLSDSKPVAPWEESFLQTQREVSQKVELGELLDLGRRMDASDLHLCVGLPPIFRICGRLTPYQEISPMTETTIHSYVMRFWTMIKRKSWRRICL